MKNFLAIKITNNVKIEEKMIFLIDGASEYLIHLNPIKLHFFIVCMIELINL